MLNTVSTNKNGDEETGDREPACFGTAFPEFVLPCVQGAKSLFATATLAADFVDPFPHERGAGELENDCQ